MMKKLFYFMLLLLASVHVYGQSAICTVTNGVTISGTDYVPLCQATVSRKFTIASLAAWIGTNSGAALTKTDDANVTLTLGGTPATALLKAASLTLGWTGQLSLARGGTGQATANAALNAFLPSQAAQTGKFLQTDGSNTSWQSAAAAVPLNEIPFGTGTGLTSDPSLTYEVVDGVFMIVDFSEGQLFSFSRVNNTFDVIVQETASGNKATINLTADGAAPCQVSITAVDDQATPTMATALVCDASTGLTLIGDVGGAVNGSVFSVDDPLQKYIFNKLNFSIGAVPYLFPGANAVGVLTNDGIGNLTWTSPGGGGTVTSVSFTGGLISVANPTTTPALTVAGTSGGVPYFSSTSTWASSGLLSLDRLVIGGGVGAAPSTTLTGSGVLTALGVSVGSAGAFVVNGGALGTPSSGTLTNCTFPTLNQNTTGTAAGWTTGRTLSITGDLAYTSPSWDGTGNVTAAGTLATVNGNVGSFGSATQTGVFTVNAKGLITAASNATITPAVGSITGFGTGVATALAVNVGSAGAFVTFNGAGGTPSSLTLTSATGLPPTTGIVGWPANASGVLTNNGSGTLSWAAAGGGSQTPWTSDINADGFVLYGNDGASETLTLGSTSNATKGKILFGTSAYDEVNNRLGIQQTTPTSKLHLNANQNSVTQADANGILLANSTAAILGTQSISPPLVLQGFAWETTGSTSQDVRWRMDVLPVQSSTSNSLLQFSSSINAGAYAVRMSIAGSSGNMTLGGALAMGGALTGATTGAFSSSAIFGTNAMNLWNPSPGTVTNSTLAQYLFAGASGVGLRVGIRGSVTTAPTASNSYASFLIGDNAINEAGSGTHALIAQQVIKQLTITGGAGATTNTAGLYIEGAPTGITPTGANYALWSDAGLNRFDGGIVGTATNDAATALNVGEEINSTISTYTNYTTTATYQAITSITLTAGDWDLSAFMTYSANAATITAASNAIFVISTTTASAAGAMEGQNIAYIAQGALLGTSLFSDAISPYRVSISGTTTYYLNTQATFTLGNPQYVGSIRARRIR